MRANNLLGIMEDTRNQLVTDANQTVTNQKEVDNWEALDGWAMAIFSTAVEPTLRRARNGNNCARTADEIEDDTRAAN